MKKAKCPVKMYLCRWKNIRLIFLNLNPGSLVLNETTMLKDFLSVTIQALRKVFWVKSKKRTWSGAWWDLTMKSEAATEKPLFGSCITSTGVYVFSGVPLATEAGDSFQKGIRTLTPKLPPWIISEGNSLSVDCVRNLPRSGPANRGYLLCLEDVAFSLHHGSSALVQT